MLGHKKVVISAALALVGVLVGCSSSPSATKTTTKTDGGSAAASARPKTKPKTASLKSKAGKTPPAGAKSTGAQTKPKAGAVTVPITGVEVYTFEESVGDGLPPETVSWAYVEGVGNYIWSTGSVTCNDGSVDSTAGFLMEVKDDGTGSYLFSLPGCPSGDLFGCDFDADGNDVSCGACVIDNEALVCEGVSE